VTCLNAFLAIGNRCMISIRVLVGQLGQWLIYMYCDWPVMITFVSVSSNQEILQMQTDFCLLTLSVPGGTPLHGLYRYVPRDRVGFLRFSILK